MPETPTTTPATPGKPRAGSRGPYQTGVRRRERLVMTAMEIFAEHGYAGSSIRTIAEGAGVSHASVIQHFGSKEGLLIAVLTEWDRRTVHDGLADVSGLDYFRRLPEVISAHRHHRGLLELFTTIAAEASSPSHPAHAFIQERYARNLATLAGHLRQATDDGDVAPMTDMQIEVEVRLITAALDGIGLQWLIDPSTDIAATVAAYIERAVTAWSPENRF